MSWPAASRATTRRDRTLDNTVLLWDNATSAEVGTSDVARRLPAVSSQTEVQEDILVRLRRIEGQIRGLQRMVDEHRQCEEVITQLMAARAALDKVGLIALQHYVDDCIPSCSESEREQLKKALDLVFKLPSISGS
jgi:DNA-binding FrmR family transcriptional regulator